VAREGPPQQLAPVAGRDDQRYAGVAHARLSDRCKNARLLAGTG
jgi:hypothetical protein